MRRPLIHKILAGLVGLLILAAAGTYFWARQRVAALPNEMQHISGPVVVPFEWVPHKSGDITLPHGAMIVPVTLGGCKRFRMQFDLGTTSSILYRPKMDNLGERCAVPPMIERDGQRYALNMDIVIGDATLYAAEIAQRQTSGQPIDWANPDTPELIGTLGADLIDGKLVVIDYPGKRLIIGDSLPGEYSQPAQWGTFTFEDRRVVLNARIDVGAGMENTRLGFDTGAGAFALLTSSGDWEALATPGATCTAAMAAAGLTCVWEELEAPSATPQVLTMISPDGPITLHRVKSDKQIEVAGVTLPVGYVTRMQGVSFMQNLPGRIINMGGYPTTAGNALFVDKVLVLDVKQGRVGVTQRK